MLFLRFLCPIFFLSEKLKTPISPIVLEVPTMVLTILEEQIGIFEELIGLEKEKRRSIGAANGPRLEKLLRRSEKSMGKLENLDKALLQESRTFLGIEKDAQSSPTLKELVDYSRKKNRELESQNLEKLSERYKELALQLKDLVQANQELLEGTNQRIQTLLGDLQEQETSPFSKTYSPKDNPSAQKASVSRALDSRLVNAGA